MEWLKYYWPLFTAPAFVAQIRGERPDRQHRIAFRPAICELAERYGSQGLWLLLKDLETAPMKIAPYLRQIAHTVRVGLVTYAGTKHNAVFHFVRELDDRRCTQTFHSAFGWIGVPESIWLDICRFDHWIEGSVVMHWATLTADMNVGSTMEQFLPCLVTRVGDERDTSEIRSILTASDVSLECVWTGASLGRTFHVDHTIPYAVWGNNDFWNLLPCQNRANIQKSDSLPSQALIKKRSECIIGYWRFYKECFSARFDVQIARALGCDPLSQQWEKPALGGLQENIQRLAASRGLGLWSPR